MGAKRSSHDPETTAIGIKKPKLSSATQSPKSQTAEIRDSKQEARKDTEKGRNQVVQSNKKQSKAGTASTATSPAAELLHPFEHDPADDCETCFQAYCDVAPLLTKLAQKLGKPKEELKIWDPYYCAGKTKEHLRKLGFPKVHNENEDCYSRIDSGDLPDYDVLLTSPPYSRDHVERIVAFAGQSNKPWFFLMPQYVHRKVYYEPLVAHMNPFFIVPAAPYVYHAHHGGRKDNTKVPCRHWVRDGKCPIGDTCKFMHANLDAKQKKEQALTVAGDSNKKELTPVTPFKSVWHFYMGSSKRNEGTIAWWLQKFRKSKCKLVKNLDELSEMNLK